MSESFTTAEQASLTKLMHEVRDWLLGQKGKMVTFVHYNPRFSRPGEILPDEEYGLLCMRVSPHADRRGVLIKKEFGWYNASYHVDLGQLLPEEVTDAAGARQKRLASHATGVARYESADIGAGRLSLHLKDYLLDGYLPQHAIRT